MATYEILAGRSRSLRSVQENTEAAPGASDAGVELGMVASILPVVRAPEGQTFTSGILRCWVQPPGLGRYVRAPEADVDLSPAAGLREAALPSMPIDYPAGRITWVADGVVLSGGAGIEVDFYCTSRDERGEAL